MAFKNGTSLTISNFDPTICELLQMQWANFFMELVHTKILELRGIIHYGQHLMENCLHRKKSDTCLK